MGWGLASDDSRGRSASGDAFTVNNTGDAVDANLGNGVCATAGAVCTLRAAIGEANALAGPDTIGFSIGSGAQTITLSSTLTISSQITIDGTTQPSPRSPAHRSSASTVPWLESMASRSTATATTP